MFSLRKRDAALQITGKQVPDGRVASLDYTQLQENAASEGLSAGGREGTRRSRGQPARLDC